jgi:triosephosphate isomerase
MKKIVVGNWKMHGGPALARDMLLTVARPQPSLEVVLCPPAVSISQVADILHTANASAKTGAQDCAAQSSGAFTGDISAEMLRQAGAEYVIVGHSERRTLHHESSETVRQKALQAIKANLIPIICIGETETERSAGKAEAVVGRQIQESIPDEAKNYRFILAYEPVWAIGSGKTPTPGDIEQMHAYITEAAAKRTGLAPATISVLYGGSVNAGNAGAIMKISGVAGVLVGGASLKPDEFGKIIAAAAG